MAAQYSMCTLQYLFSPKKQPLTILELRRKKKDGVCAFYHNTMHKLQEKPYFCNICPSGNDIVYALCYEVTPVLDWDLLAMEALGEYHWKEIMKRLPL